MSISIRALVTWLLQSFTLNKSANDDYLARVSRGWLACLASWLHVHLLSDANWVGSLSSSSRRKCILGWLVRLVPVPRWKLMLKSESTCLRNVQIKIWVVAPESKQTKTSKKIIQIIALRLCECYFVWYLSLPSLTWPCLIKLDEYIQAWYTIQTSPIRFHWF